MFNPLTGIRDIMGALNFNVRFFSLVYIKSAFDMMDIKSVLKSFLVSYILLSHALMLLLLRPYHVVLHPMQDVSECFGAVLPRLPLCACQSHPPLARLE